METQQSSKNTDSDYKEATYPNRSRNINKAIQIFLIATYPMAVWFGYFVIKFWPSLVGFSIVWLLLFLYLQYQPYEPILVRFGDSGFSIKYRKGEKAVQYGEIVRVEWLRDFTGGGILVKSRSGDVVFLGGIDKKLLDETLKRIGQARPNFGWDTRQHVNITSKKGTISEKEFENDSLQVGLVKAYSKDFFFWGYRPKKGRME